MVMQLLVFWTALYYLAGLDPAKVYARGEDRDRYVTEKDLAGLGLDRIIINSVSSKYSMSTAQKLKNL